MGGIQAAHRCENNAGQVEYRAYPCDHTESEKYIATPLHKRTDKEIIAEKKSWEKLYNKQKKAEIAQIKKACAVKNKENIKNIKIKEKQKAKCKDYALKIKVLQHAIRKLPLHKQGGAKEDKLYELETKQAEECKI